MVRGPQILSFTDIRDAAGSICVASVRVVLVS